MKLLRSTSPISRSATKLTGAGNRAEHATCARPGHLCRFAKQFAAFAAQIDPNIAIGVDGSGTGGSYSQIPGNWTDQGAGQCAAGLHPQFHQRSRLHVRTYRRRNDATLLLDETDPNAVGYGGPINWAGRAAAYQALINKDLGRTGAGVQLLATEFNSVSYNPSNQTTSLVNGLWLADSLAGLYQTEYDGAIVSVIRNGYDTTYDNPSLYGWHAVAQTGLLGSGSGPMPATGSYVPYPTYFAEELVSKIVDTGDAVSAGGKRRQRYRHLRHQGTNGHLDLLIINRNPSTNLNEQFDLTGFARHGPGNRMAIKGSKDTAQSESINGTSSLANFTQTLSINGSDFSFLAPRYSITVSTWRRHLAIRPGISHHRASAATFAVGGAGSFR